jgi:hypothetical protein
MTNTNENENDHEKMSMQDRQSGDGMEQNEMPNVSRKSLLSMRPRAKRQWGQARLEKLG